MSDAHSAELPTMSGDLLEDDGQASCVQRLLCAAHG